MDTLALVNLALARLGAQSYVASLDENSTEARLARAVWPQAVRSALAAHEWKFATVTEPLAAAGAPPAQSAWAYQYALPADCVQPLAVVNPAAAQPGPFGSFSSTFTDRVPWERSVGRDDTGQRVPVVLTSQPHAVLRYVALVESPAAWDPGFAAAFSWRLAAELAMPLTGKPDLMQAMLMGFQGAVREATVANVQNGQGTVSHVPEWIAARGGR